jgi:hypothetical protein
MVKKKHLREERIERAIKLTWSSLRSHLEWTHKKSPEGHRFHKACVQEYAETIKILSSLY